MTHRSAPTTPRHRSAVIALLLGMLVTDIAAAQARLTGPRRDGDPDRPSADTLEVERLTPAQRERELDRLRRRTGTAASPAPIERAPRAQPILPPDAGFEVLVDTDAPEYYAGDGEDDLGEPMFIRITSARDGYLTLLTGGTGRDLGILAPNDLIASFPILAGEPVNFPLQQWVQQGIELRPQLPPDTEVSQQTLIAVVTRRPVPLPLLDPNLADWRDGDRRIAVRTFQTWLARLPVGERGLGQAFYLVRRR